MNVRKLLLSAAAMLASASAFAGYTIDRTDGGNNTLLVAGRWYEYRIYNTNHPNNDQDVFIEMSTPDYDIFAAPGIQTGSSPYPKFSLTNGELIVSIRFHTAGNYSMTVMNSQDNTNRATLNNIVVEHYPVTFSISPDNPTWTANVARPIDITARDASNVIVTAFQDPVQITVSQQGNSSVLIDSGAFVNGTAAGVMVNVKAADINNKFTLDVLLAGQQFYDPTLPAPSLAPRAEAISPIYDLQPDVYRWVVMLFPGETLNPGAPKFGTPLDVKSGYPVTPDVKVYATDQFFNPLKTLPGGTLPVEFTSGATTYDSIYYPLDMTMTTPLLDITGAMGKIIFGGSGDRLFTVTPNGDATKASNSLIHVTPGQAEDYIITVQGVADGSSITTDQVLNVTIEAMANNQRLTTLFGQVPNAQLLAQFGGQTGAEDVRFVDTDDTTLVPDNVVDFKAGLATLSLVVTKFGSSCKLHYKTPDKDAYSNVSFNVNAGVPSKIHFTVLGKAPTPTQGETWTPGIYPGNSGQPPVIRAGDTVVVEARVTDRHWNAISGGGDGWNFRFSNNDIDGDGIPECYISGTNVKLSGPIYTFPSNGLLEYDADPSFDKSFRVQIRTAGPSSLVPAPVIRGDGNQGTFFSSSMTVLPQPYSQMVVAAPGEKLRPGTNLENDGKSGAPTAEQAGVAFNVTAYAVDPFFNPVVDGPFPTVNFTLTPNVASSFVSGALPSAMQSGSKLFSVTLSTPSSLKIYDTADATRNQTISIPLNNGPLDHFRLIFNDPSDKEAGVPYGVTLRAEDRYGNQVMDFNQSITLLANTGATTMTPETLPLTSGLYQGNLTNFAAGDSVRIKMTYGSISTDSDPFRVNVNSQGYRRLLSILPGETMMPGTPAGKQGTPTETAVGIVVPVRAIACDLYYNPLPTAGRVQFASDHYAQFGGATGDLTMVDGHGEYTTTLVLQAATTHTISLKDVNLDGTVSRSSSTIVGDVGPYRQIQVLLPGEVADPGSVSGKTSATPLDQKAGIPFDIQIRAVDQYWNLVTAETNVGDTHLESNTSVVLFQPPNNSDTPGDDPSHFVAGISTRTIIFGQDGRYQITATDVDDLTRTGQTVQVNVLPGPSYVITASSTATAGSPFDTVHIALQQNGVPLSGYSGKVYLTANLASGGPASGAFTPDGTPKVYTMNNGVVDITDLSYAYVETITIKVTDDFNRVGFSNPIQVVPHGLKYRVTVPAQGVAGPPSTFDVKVELLDDKTETLVKNHPHQVNVEVISAVNAVTNGSYTVTSANISQGIAEFQQSYTKAESVVIRISESSTNGDPDYVIPSAVSNNINIIADGYKKLQIIAPGETAVPGVASPTGKTGTPTPRQAGVPFVVQVHGVDQYWNVASQFDKTGAIVYDSDDIPESLNSTNPTNQGAPLINGETAASINLKNAGDIHVTVKDANNAAIGIQTDAIRVSGNYYEVNVPDPVVYAGPPNTFSITIVLRDSESNNIVTSAPSHIVDLVALKANQPADGVLGIREAQVINGVATITGETYNVPENIVISVTERTEKDVKATGHSPEVKVFARQVRYTFEMPAEADVNTPFPLTIRMIDQDTGNPVLNQSRSNDLEVYSTISGAVATGVFVPRGTGAVNIVDGVATLSATYNKTEPIFFKMTDNTPGSQPAAPTQSVFTSQGSINIKPGALAKIINLDNGLPIADWSMQSNERKQFHLEARDTYDNPIPGQTLHISMISPELPGGMSMNGSLNDLVQKMNANGDMDMMMEPTKTANGVYSIKLEDADHVHGFSQVLNATILGLSEAPPSAPPLGGYRIARGTDFSIPDVQAIQPPSNPADLLRVWYRVDGSAYVPYIKSLGITSSGTREGRNFVTFDQLKTYKVEWYQEICYGGDCNNSVSSLNINGGPDTLFVTTVEPSDKLNAYPSPFNPKADSNNVVTFQYPLDRDSDVEVDVYDLFGQKVWGTRVAAGSSAGRQGNLNQVLWDGVNQDGRVVAPNGYVARVKVDATGQVMKTKFLVVW